MAERRPALGLSDRSGFGEGQVAEVVTPHALISPRPPATCGRGGSAHCRSA
jgi:hypothetical protein